MRKNSAVQIHGPIDDRSIVNVGVAPSEPVWLCATLRASTAATHGAIDEELSRLDLADAADYRRFLRIQLAALSSLSAVWGTRDRDDLESLIGCLRTGLSDWGPAPVSVSDANAVRTPFTEAGIAYVVRVSRLGAAVLMDQVGPHLPTCYLSHRPLGSWPTFLAQLCALDAVADRDAIDDCLAAAPAAFAVFAHAAHATPIR